MRTYILLANKKSCVDIVDKLLITLKRESFIRRKYEYLGACFRKIKGNYR